MTAKEHNKLVGIFLLAHGGFQAVVMLLVALVYGVMGSAMLASARRDEQAMVGGIFLAMVAFVVIFSAILIIPQILGGWKLLKEKSGARTWGIVGSIIACLSFPLGTAAGVYGLWFLFGDEGKRFYLGGGQQQPPLFDAPHQQQQFDAQQQQFNAPPPNNWR